MVDRSVSRGAAVSRGDFLRPGGLGLAGAALLPPAGCGGAGEAQDQGR